MVRFLLSPVVHCPAPSYQQRARQAHAAGRSEWAGGRAGAVSWEKLLIAAVRLAALIHWGSHSALLFPASTNIVKQRGHDAAFSLNAWRLSTILEELFPGDVLTWCIQQACAVQLVLRCSQFGRTLPRESRASRLRRKFNKRLFLLLRIHRNNGVAVEPAISTNAGPDE